MASLELIVLLTLPVLIERRCIAMGNILEFYQNSERYKDVVNMNVIKFIDKVSNFPDRDGDVGGHIDNLFCAGYCYYFASMLQIAFNGRICWAQDRGHIVWVDCAPDCSFDDLQNSIAYDITGVYDDYELLWPVEYLGDALINYLHTDKELHISTSFYDWCDFYHMSEAFAIDLAWGVATMDVILENYKRGLDYTQTAYLFLMQHLDTFQEIFTTLKNTMKISGFPRHKGVDIFLTELKQKCGIRRMPDL